jgi:hypothetical protein
MPFLLKDFERLPLNQNSMKNLLSLFFVVIFSFTFAQSESILVKTLPDGRYTLSESGASYFAKLSLDCSSKSSPHFYFKALRKPGDKEGPRDLWPSFYGCYDWHSGVHNHWCMVKLLKLYPNLPEAKDLKEKLELSFSKENIISELNYVKSHENGFFEFPYGQSWLLKVADELKNWDNPDAKRWLENLKPLSDYIAFVHLKVWPQVKEVELSGSHDSPAMALSFAYDYAVSFNDLALKKVVVAAAKKYYGKMSNAPIIKEPFEYDFMSASLLVNDLMRKVLPEKKYWTWVNTFTPELFSMDKVDSGLQIKKSEKHDGYESHWDGYHLNRIWCLNGMLKSIPPSKLDSELKKKWVIQMNDMWDYAQESIGKGNYDIDHWLSSFSVFALVGYE